LHPTIAPAPHLTKHLTLAWLLSTHHTKHQAILSLLG